MRKLALMLAQCLLLAGCTGLPKPREMGEMALLRTVGVDGAEASVTITASTGERASGTEGNKQPPLILTGEGASLSAASLDLRAHSDSWVFSGYVDKLLLGQDASLSDVLGWFAHDDELALGAKLWLLRDVTAAQAVGEAGESGVERRLSALELDERLGAAPMTRRAGEVYSTLLDRGCAFLPALTAGEELTPAGYAVVLGEEIVGYLEGEAARGLELLAEQPVAEILELPLPENRVSLQITGAQLDCRPRFENGQLVKLELTSRVNAQLRQWERTLTAREREELSAAAAEQLEGKLRAALEPMRLWQAECVGIGSRVAIAAPWHWNRLEDRWQEVFSGVEYELNVKVSLG